MKAVSYKRAMNDSKFNFSFDLASFLFGHFLIPEDQPWVGMIKYNYDS